MKPKKELKTPLKFFDKKGFLAVLVALAAIFVFFVLPLYTQAATNDELEQKIAESNAKIAELEREIAQYENQLVTIGNQKATLENEVSRLDLSRKKIGADISATQSKINSADLELENLGGEIGNKERQIENGRAVIGRSLRTIYQEGETTFAEQILASAKLSDVWEETDKLRRLESALRDEIKVLQNTKEELRVNYEEVEDQQVKLIALKRELAGQKAVLDQNRQEQATLLSQTKNKESGYQKLLDEKREAKAEFEQQINEYENQLAYNLDPSKIPSPGSGVLNFPLSDDFMSRCITKEKVYGNIYCITQYFGNTAFAQSGAYNGKGHNGIDFGIPEGTRIGTALSGVVQAVGNTDQYRGCYSYGKWVLVRHGNGLSTLYAHLSHISVGAGESVGTGGLIGYSGKTGYATGPHLHFTVYVADAVQLVRLGDIKSKTNCANAIVPVAATAAYLNPIQYL